MKEFKNELLVRKIGVLLGLAISLILLTIGINVDFKVDTILIVLGAIGSVVFLVFTIIVFMEKLEVYNYKDNEIGIYCGFIHKYLFVNNRKVYKVKNNGIFSPLTLSYYNDELDIEVYVKKVNKTSMYINGEVITK